MARSEGSSDPTTKNLHVEVPDEFHRRVKILAIQSGKTLKEWTLNALKEQVTKEEAELLKKQRRGG